MSVKIIPYLLHGSTACAMAGLLFISLSNSIEIQQIKDTELSTSSSFPPATQQLAIEDDQLKQLQQDVDGLYNQVDSLLQALESQRLTAVESGSVSSADTVDKPASSKLIQTRNDSLKSQGKTIYTQLSERGYVTEDDWSKTVPTLEAMTPDENKAFWESMNAALAKGELQILMPDTEG